MIQRQRTPRGLTKRAVVINIPIWLSLSASTHQPYAILCPKIPLRLDVLDSLSRMKLLLIRHGETVDNVAQLQ